MIVRDSCSDRMQNPADQGHHMPDMWIHTMAGRCGRCRLEIVRAKGRAYMARLPWTRKWVDAKTDLTCDFVLTQAVHES